MTWASLLLLVAELPPWLDAPRLLPSLVVVVPAGLGGMAWGAGEPLPGERAGFQLRGCGAAANVGA